MTTLTIFVDDEQIDLKGNGYIAEVDYNTDEFNELAVSAFNQQLELLDVPIEIAITITEGNLVPEKLAHVNNRDFDRPVTVTITAKRLPHPTKKPKYLTMYYRKLDGNDNSVDYWSRDRFDDLNLASDTKPCTIDLDNPQEWVVGYPTTVPAGLVELGSSRLVNYLTALTIDVSEPNNDVTPYVANMVGNLAAYDPRVPIAMVRLQNTSETERRVKVNSDEVNFALMDFGSSNGGDPARVVDNDAPFSPEGESATVYGNYSIIIPPLKDAIVCLTNSKISDGALPRYPMPTEENPLGVEFNLEHHTWKNASTFYRIGTYGAQNISVGKYAESINPITGVSEYGYFIIFPERYAGSGENIYDIDQRTDAWGTQYYRQNDIKYITWPGGPDVALAGDVFKDSIVANSNYGRSGAILYVPEGHSAAMYLPWNVGYNYSLAIRTLTRIMDHLNLGWISDINIPQLADGTWMGKFNINNNTFAEYIQPWPQKDTLFPKMRSGLPVHYGVANLVMIEGLQTLKLTVPDEYVNLNWSYNIAIYVNSELNEYLGKASDEPCNPIFSLALDEAEQNPIGYSKSGNVVLVPIVALAEHANVPLTLVVNTEFIQAGWYLEVDAIKGAPV